MLSDKANNGEQTTYTTPLNIQSHDQNHIKTLAVLQILTASQNYICEAYNHKTY